MKNGWNDNWVTNLYVSDSESEPELEPEPGTSRPPSSSPLSPDEWVVGPRDERPPFQVSRKPGGASSLKKRHPEHLLKEHARAPRAAAQPCAGATSPPQTGAASPPRTGVASRKPNELWFQEMAAILSPLGLYAGNRKSKMPLEGEFRNLCHRSNRCMPSDRNLA
jgi:hypothetical protein